MLISPQMTFRSLFTSILVFAGCLFVTGNASGQYGEWSKFVPLKTQRAEIEKLLGPPDKYFATYGTYDTKEGSFSVWYSDGKCLSNRAGLQYNIPAGLLTRIYFRSNKSLSMRDYAQTPDRFVVAIDHGSKSGRFFYVSEDNSKVFEIIPETDGTEKVYGIWIQPDKNGEQFLCRKK